MRRAARTAHAATSIRCAVVLLVLGRIFVAQAEELTSVEHGKALVTDMCARCHAVGTTGESPHPGAPPFRQLHRVVDFNGFVDRLREGLMVGHPDMPTFRFARQDARAVAAYLSSIQQTAR